MQEQFVSEIIRPVAGTMDTASMAVGKPGLPGRFVWRGEEYAVDVVLERWKETSPCRHGSEERYVRKHWFRVRTTSGAEMRIYFDRQAKDPRRQTARWWLYSVIPPCGDGKPSASEDGR